MRMSSLAVAVALAVAWGAPALAQQAESDEKALPSDDRQVVIIIDGEPIYMGRLQRAFNSFGRDLGELDPQAFYLAVMDRVIDQELAARAAVSSGLADTTDVRAELEQARTNILANAFLSKTARDEVSTADLRKRYEKMAATGVKQVKASHILVKSRQEAVDIIDQLKEGGDFAVLARQHSIGPSGQNGGDLGFFGKGQMVKPFADAAFALEKGAYTEEPVETRFGWHVIKVFDTQTESLRPFAEMQQELLNEARTEAMLNALSKLRSAATVQRFAPDGTAFDPAPEDGDKK